jgi:hypothetical protein
MTDFSWTQQFALIPVRSVVQAALEQVGIQFTALPATLSPQQRPRTIGETADSRLRIELIGPGDVIFKATIIAHIAEPVNAGNIYPDLAHFLTIVAPTWAEGSGWLEAHLARLEQQISATTQYRELVIALRTARNRRQITLGVTWQGPAQRMPILSAS